MENRIVITVSMLERILENAKKHYVTANSEIILSNPMGAKIVSAELIGINENNEILFNHWQ